MDREYVLASYARDYTNFIRGEGARLYDESGREYIDFASGIGVSSVGHGHPRLTDALCEQASKLIHISNLQVIEPQARLAKRLVELSGYDMRCFFGNSGAEANEAALKIARKYGETHFENKRYKVITLKHSFHGRTITTVKATGQAEMHKPDFSPYPAGFGYVESIDDIYGEIDGETVAVMIELVQGEGGVQPFEKDEVQALAKYLRSQGLLLIVDEVQTGVYRTGEFLASQLYEIEPDVITLAKGLGGGVPIGVAMTRLKEIFRPGDHGSTFGGNYLSSRAGLTVLEILEEEQESGELQERIIYFSRNLQRLAESLPELFGEAVGLGLMRGLRCRSAEIQGRILKAAFAEGLILLKAGRNTVRFLPPLVISRHEMEEGFLRLERALESLS
jgi:acetylornithine aminotransferase